MSITVRLEADGLDPLELNPHTGWAIQTLDLGDPETRSVVDPAPDADGTIDDTQFIGARTVTLALKAVPSVDAMWAMRRRLRAFTAPRLRPIMYVREHADAPELRVQLRRSAWSNVLGQVGFAPIAAQWVAPLGVLESVAEHELFANAAGSTGGGRTYDRTYDRTYPSASPAGSATVANAGDIDAWPLLRVYGPCTDPIVSNDTAGRDLAFVGLTILAGEFLEIDTRARTIRYLGAAADSRYDTLDFPASQWWSLAPGDNAIRFHPATFSPPSQTQIVWRDTYL